LGLTENTLWQEDIFTPVFLGQAANSLHVVVRNRTCRS
jgi:hypothetical protein